MKQKIEIKRGESTVYAGRISDMPIKHTSIIQKSIELFDDDDPCIIHQSYVIKEYADLLLGKLQKTNPVVIQDHNDLEFIDIVQPEECTIQLKG